MANNWPYVTNLVYEILFNANGGWIFRIDGICKSDITGMDQNYRWRIEKVGQTGWDQEALISDKRVVVT